MNPPPDTLFSLVPYGGNQAAKDAIAHTDNRQRVWNMGNDNMALAVGFHIKSGSHTILATVGRHLPSIVLDDRRISRVQCAFEINLDSNVIMLSDRSSQRSTQIYPRSHPRQGEKTTPFEADRDRRVVVQQKLNTVIGMGGSDRQLFMFELIWHLNPEETMSLVRTRTNNGQDVGAQPNVFPTVMDVSLTTLSSRQLTQPSSPSDRRLWMRYAIIGEKLGAGAYGRVCKAVDADSGRLMAVKLLNRPKDESERRRQWPLLSTREVGILTFVRHPHIIEFIASQGWDQPVAEIFMTLREGSLHSLMTSSVNVSESAFHQILQALDYLSVKGIAHRDVKPENILWVRRGQDNYHFELSDFGLSNVQTVTSSNPGTVPYIAPERVKTHKSDIWSLFVTMVWALNINNFRGQTFRDSIHAQDMVMEIARTSDRVSRLRNMVCFQQEKRASAAQLLQKLFKGEGLSTSANMITPLRRVDNASLERPPDQAPPGSAVPSEHNNPGDMPGDVDMRGV